jgi:membrane protein implicated in regulation of membrane protease activity
LKTLLADWRLALGMLAAAVAAVAMIAYAFFRPAEAPQDVERKRRLHLNQIGRIAEGQVVDLIEHPPESSESSKRGFGSRARPLPDTRPRHLVSYSYAISGVTYHTAQDITGLEGQIRFERLVAGQPASVKYDPSNPSDSILVADDWSGLR